MSWSGQKCIQKIFIRCRNERNRMKGQKTRFVFRRIGNSAVTFHRMWHFIERRLIDRSSQVDLKSRLIYSRVLVIFLGFNLLTRLSNVCVFFNGSILASFSLFSSYLYYTIDRYIFDNVGIRTADLCCWKRPLCQLCHNHYPQCLFLCCIVFNDATFSSTFWFVTERENCPIWFIVKTPVDETFSIWSRRIRSSISSASDLHQVVRHFLRWRQQLKKIVKHPFQVSRPRSLELRLLLMLVVVVVIKALWGVNG